MQDRDDNVVCEEATNDNGQNLPNYTVIVRGLLVYIVGAILGILLILNSGILVEFPITNYLDFYMFRQWLTPERVFLLLCFAVFVLRPFLTIRKGNALTLEGGLTCAIIAVGTYLFPMVYLHTPYEILVCVIGTMLTYFEMYDELDEISPLKQVCHVFANIAYVTTLAVLLMADAILKSELVL